MMSSRAMDSQLVLFREYRGVTETLRQARSDVGDWLDERHMGPDLRERAELVTLCHGCPRKLSVFDGSLEDFVRAAPIVSRLPGRRHRCRQ